MQHGGIDLLRRHRTLEHAGGLIPASLGGDDPGSAGNRRGRRQKRASMHDTNSSQQKTGCNSRNPTRIERWWKLRRTDSRNADAGGIGEVMSWPWVALPA